jgi:hypothetical protein
MSNNPNKCLSCGYPYKPSFGRCPNCGKTTGQAFLKALKIQGCILVVFLLLGLLGMLLKALGLLPEQ